MSNEELLKKVKEMAEKKHDATCPNCGHCPTCGRRNAAPYPLPYYPPAYPWWPVALYYGPTWISNGTSITTTTNPSTWTAVSANVPFSLTGNSSA